VQAVDSEFKGVQQSDHSRLAQLMCHTVSNNTRHTHRHTCTQAHRRVSTQTYRQKDTRTNSLCHRLRSPPSRRGGAGVCAAWVGANRTSTPPLLPPTLMHPALCCAVLCRAVPVHPHPSLSVGGVTCTTSSAGVTCAACGSSQRRLDLMCGNTSSTFTGVMRAPHVLTHKHSPTLVILRKSLFYSGTSATCQL
jgi:hypothetical protein